MTEDMLARFIVEDPELTNTIVSTAKAYLDPVLSTDNIRGYGDQLIQQGFDEDIAYVVAFDDLIDVGRRAATDVHRVVDALVKGKTIPLQHKDAAHSLVRAYLYFGIKRLKSEWARQA